MWTQDQFLMSAMSGRLEDAVDRSWRIYKRGEGRWADGSSWHWLPQTYFPVCQSVLGTEICKI